MSRNSKNARNLAKARQISEMRKKGDGGAAKTVPTHGKRWTYRHNPEIQKRLAEAVKGMAEAKLTAAEKILARAGKAAQ
jgi:hypothetical protein